jgi:solute carrier family 35, member F5
MVIYLPVAFLKDWICNNIMKKKRKEISGISEIITKPAQKVILEMESLSPLSRKDSNIDISSQTDEESVALIRYATTGEFTMEKYVASTMEIMKYGFYLAPIWFVTEVRF